jgi:ribonuclease HII
MIDKSIIIGCDEVGTGSLAGPLVVCGISAPKDWTLEGLNDSKKLSAKKREAMCHKFLPLIENGTIAWHTAERSNAIIDELGLAAALKDAYVEVFKALYQDDCLIIVDGNLKFDNLEVDGFDKISMVKADTKIPTVMAASILAKVTRDAQMHEWHKDHPVYDFISNVGYGSAKHLKAIAEHGPCYLHRMSYAPMRNIK